MHIAEEEKTAMFSKKGLFIAAVLVLTSSFLSVSAANAQPPTACYTLVSLQGSYAVIVNYGANIALGLQAQFLDGNGNLTRTGVLNQPVAGSTTGARTVGTVSATGTYTVNCDGTGTMTRIVTRPDGSTAPAVDDFIVTGATLTYLGAKGWQFVATTIVDAQRDPSVILPGGVFVTRVHTRLPDRDQGLPGARSLTILPFPK
jgi:hypothetical protein